MKNDSICSQLLSTIQIWSMEILQSAIKLHQNMFFQHCTKLESAIKSFKVLYAKSYNPFIYASSFAWSSESKAAKASSQILHIQDWHGRLQVTSCCSTLQQLHGNASQVFLLIAQPCSLQATGKPVAHCHSKWKHCKQKCSKDCCNCNPNIRFLH